MPKIPVTILTLLSINTITISIVNSKAGMLQYIFCDQMFEPTNLPLVNHAKLSKGLLMLREYKFLSKRERTCNKQESLKKVIMYSAKLLQKKLNYMIADCEQRLDLKAGTSRSLDLKTRCKSRHKQKSLREVLC